MARIRPRSQAIIYSLKNTSCARQAPINLICQRDMRQLRETLSALAYYPLKRGLAFSFP